MGEAVVVPPDDQPQIGPSWRLWIVAKQELLYLCWALMEIALLTPIILTFMRWARFWPEAMVTLWLLLLLLLPFNLARTLSTLQISKKTQRRVLIIALLLTLLFSWRIMLFDSLTLFDLSWISELLANVGRASFLWVRTLSLFLLILFAWWRGLRLVQLQPDLHKAGLHLRVGILLFVPVALLPRSGANPWGFLPYVLLFFLSGLMAVALIRAEQVEQERSGFAASLSPRWIGTIAVVTLLIVFSTALFAVLVGGETLSLFLQWLSPVRRAALVGATVALSTAFFLASPLFFLLEIVLTWLAQLFIGFSSTFGLDAGSALDGFDSLFPAEEEAIEAVGFTIPAEVTRGLIILVMLALVILVSYALTRRFRQPPLTPQAGGPIRAAGGSTVPGDRFSQRLLQRLRFFRRWRTAASIRQLYQAMCDTAAAAGQMRSPSETPYEYLKVLNDVWPANAQDTRLITEAYVKVRYGEIPETEEELREIREAWRRLQKSEPLALQTRSEP